MLRFVWLMVSMVASGCLFAADEVQTGMLTLKFNENSPLSDPKLVIKRTSFKAKRKDLGSRKYKLSNESFQVHVPKDYASWKSFGLLVWVNSTDEGKLPKQWSTVLDKHHLICVAANGSGDGHDDLRRVSLALDGAHNVMRQYRIDPERVYAAGKLGGGRLASQLAVPFSDVFQGGVFVRGCEFWKNITMPSGQQGEFWEPKFEPTTKNRSIAKKTGRYVVLGAKTGANQEKTQATYEQGYRKMFKGQATYLEAPKLMGIAPDSTWFEKSIRFLDAPLKKESGKFMRKGAEYEAGKSYSKAMRQYFLAMTHGNEKAKGKIAKIEQKLKRGMAEAKKCVNGGKLAEGYSILRSIVKYHGELALDAKAAMAELEKNEKLMAELKSAEYLRKAKKHLKRDKKSKAEKYLKRIIKEYPDSPAAKEARELLGG